MNNLRFTSGKRLLFFVFISALCFLAGMAVMAVVVYKGVTPMRMRLSTLVQSIMVFLLPSLLVALTVSYKPWRYLKTFSFPLVPALVAMLGLLVAIPFMNTLVAWNEGWSLPQSMGPLEQWMREAEANAQGSVDYILGGSSLWDLILGLLLVGILPGIGEEFFFRGGLQRVLATSPGVTPHVAIWVAAFIFSAVHMQFFGFFPRLLLGAYFGYLLYWTGSLWVPVLVHALNNSLIVVAGWLDRAGLPTIDVEGMGTSSWPVVILSVLLTLLALIALYRRRAVSED